MCAVYRAAHVEIVAISGSVAFLGRGAVTIVVEAVAFVGNRVIGSDPRVGGSVRITAVLGVRNVS